MPDPFRQYEGVPVLDLPADPILPETPAIEVVNTVSGATHTDDGPTFLLQLLFYSAAISASKRVPSTGYRYALRVNPSSGNLHPTEFHFLTRGLKEWPDGLYHYRPSAHMAWPDGSVKVLDFGLAKSAEHTGSSIMQDSGWMIRRSFLRVTEHGPVCRLLSGSTR
jgi:hypothetical protein